MLRAGLLIAISLILTSCVIGGSAPKTHTPIIRPEATEVKGPRVKYTELIKKEGMQEDREIGQVDGEGQLGKGNE